MTDSNASDNMQEEVYAQSESKFAREIQGLIDRAEDFRLTKMRAYKTRSGIALAFGLIIMFAGAAGFGWLFLMKGQILTALLAIAAAVVVPVFLNIWAQRPLNAYKEEFKHSFMPAVAKTLGGLKFHPKRGISRKMLAHTGIVPPHSYYEAEDCFLGRYHGVKIILSEARLSTEKGKHDVFDGIFVLMELPEEHFQGTTVITADQNLTRQLRAKMQIVPLENLEYTGKLDFLTDAPGQVEALQQDRLLKELYEMVTLFDNSPLSCVFFRKKYVFMMIPYEIDMFECSNMYVPVTTRSTAMQCKKEIDQILSIIDVLEIYRKNGEDSP